MGKRYVIAILVLGLFAITRFSGCIESEPDDEPLVVSDLFEGNYNATGNTTLEVDNSNGYIIVTTWEQGGVKLEADKWIDEKFKEKLDEVEIIVTEENNRIIIETVYETQEGIHATVDMNIWISPSVHVETLKTSNGMIELSNTIGNTSCESSNGDVFIDNVDGYVEAHTSNGYLSVIGTTGIEDVTTSNGDVMVEVFDVKEDVEISSSNGDISIDVLPTLNLTIDMQTSLGDISISGLTLEKSLDDDTHVIGTMNGGGYKIDIHTSNGDVRLKKLVE
jgi:hypothetical protein